MRERGKEESEREGKRGREGGERERVRESSHLDQCMKYMQGGLSWLTQLSPDQWTQQIVNQSDQLSSACPGTGPEATCMYNTETRYM